MITLDDIIKMAERIKHGLKTHPDLSGPDKEYYGKELDILIDFILEHGNESSKKVN